MTLPCRYLCLTAAFLLVLFPWMHRLQANHIVGGELELVHIAGFQYHLNLIQYFDQAQNTNPGPEPFLTAYIYRKKDNQFVRRDTLLLQLQGPVPYSNIACTIAKLKTLRAFYSRSITLPPEVFNDPEGYYVVWERCCRNEGIVNIVNSLGAGQTYYLEFPAVMRDGRQFVNSSPSLFPPLSDYACVHQLYYTDFAGVDLDGDSLTYELVTPLNSSALQPLPIPQPAPHPRVVWQSGISLKNVIPGRPSLSINRKGFITVKPERIGLYVFSVLCREFRNGKKIGEVIRDFQMLVIDGCTPPPPPELQVKTPGSSVFRDKVSDTLVFRQNDNKCFDLQVTDKAGDKTITLRAVGVNFDGEVEGIFSPKKSYLAQPNEVLNVKVCLSKCPYVTNGPYLIDLIAADDACPLPQMDTVRVAVRMEPPPNQPPAYVQTPRSTSESVEEGLKYSLPLKGIDADNQTMFMVINADDFDPEDWGMEIVTTLNVEGKIEAVFQWNTDCSRYPFGRKNTFDFTIDLYDNDFCMDNASDRVNMHLTVKLPHNEVPVITSTLASQHISLPAGSLLSFSLTATDADNDLLELAALPANFDRNDYAISFQPVKRRGEVSAVFMWDLGCGLVDLAKQSDFEINFVAYDEDQCFQRDSTVFNVKLEVFEPSNHAPVISLKGLENNRVTVHSLESLELEITTTDPDNDFVWLALQEGSPLPPSPSFQFNRVEGLGKTTGVLRWSPECSLFADQKELSYKVSLVSWDTRCPNPAFDTLSVFIDLIDKVGPDHFFIANIFTPNGDGVNDTFSIPDIPADNCDDQFEYFKVLTREGTEVFAATHRHFVWDGGRLPAGIYYYVVKFRRKTFNGALTLQY